ncbi:hypothetical protein U3516DRAFT_860547 [Neocallimastix sp. 'constans']
MDININKNQLKYDSTKTFLKQQHPRLFDIEMKIKKLEIENDNFKKVKSIKKVDIKEEVYQHEDQINRVRNRKLPYNFSKEANLNEYCHYNNNIKEEKYGKFENDKKQDIFLIYSSDSLGHRFLDITLQSIIIIRDNKINLENNTDLMDKYYNENMNKLKISNLNNYENFSKLNLINYEIINQKLYESKTENNHKKNLVIMKYEKLYLEIMKYMKKIKIKVYNPENESEDNSKKTENNRKRKRKNYQSNEERKMKSRISILNKLYFKRKTNSDNENESCIRNRVNNINTLILKTLKLWKTKNIPKSINIVYLINI